MVEICGCCGRFGNVDFTAESSHTGVPMNARLIVGFLMLVTLPSPSVFAESPCAECIKTAQEALKSCLANAISVDDKNSCEENREEGMKACEDRECTAEREAKESQKDKPPQNR
jgi:hypothetical protein